MMMMMINDDHNDDDDTPVEETVENWSQLDRLPIYSLGDHSDGNQVSYYSEAEAAHSWLLV